MNEQLELSCYSLACLALMVSGKVFDLSNRKWRMPTGNYVDFDGYAYSPIINKRLLYNLLIMRIYNNLKCPNKHKLPS